MVGADTRPLFGATYPQTSDWLLGFSDKNGSGRAEKWTGVSHCLGRVRAALAHLGRVHSVGKRRRVRGRRALGAYTRPLFSLT